MLEPRHQKMTSSIYKEVRTEDLVHDIETISKNGSIANQRNVSRNCYNVFFMGMYKVIIDNYHMYDVRAYNMRLIYRVILFEFRSNSSKTSSIFFIMVRISGVVYDAQ